MVKVAKFIGKVIFLFVWFLFAVAIGTIISELLYPMEELAKIAF
jgi:hypothetical protein